MDAFCGEGGEARGDSQKAEQALCRIRPPVRMVRWPADGRGGKLPSLPPSPVCAINRTGFWGKTLPGIDCCSGKWDDPPPNRPQRMRGRVRGNSRGCDPLKLSQGFLDRLAEPALCGIRPVLTIGMDIERGAGSSPADALRMTRRVSGADIALFPPLAPPGKKRAGEMDYSPQCVENPCFQRKEAGCLSF